MNPRDYSQGNWSAEDIYHFERRETKEVCVCVLIKEVEQDRRKKRLKIKLWHKDNLTECECESVSDYRKRLKVNGSKGEKGEVCSRIKRKSVRKDAENVLRAPRSIRENGKQ